MLRTKETFYDMYSIACPSVELLKPSPWRSWTVVDVPTGTNMAAVVEERTSKLNDCVMAAEAGSCKPIVERWTSCDASSLLLSFCIVSSSFPLSHHQILSSSLRRASLSVFLFLSLGLSTWTRRIPAKWASEGYKSVAGTNKLATWNLISDKCHRPLLAKQRPLRFLVPNPHLLLSVPPFSVLPAANICLLHCFLSAKHFSYSVLFALTDFLLRLRSFSFSLFKELP